MQFDYYYNDVPGKGLCRNNLIYTSLISRDKRTFCQWYYNDHEYHHNKNKVVDPNLMNEKWQREVHFLEIMNENYPDHIPKILDIDHREKKVYLEIEGVDFWQVSGPVEQNYNTVLPDWENQMLDIINSYKKLGIYKMSLHPSSYFVINGKLKSINYFFCYEQQEKTVKVKDVLSHISDERLEKLYPLMEKKGISVDKDTNLLTAQLLAFDSFRNNYPSKFIDTAKQIYV